MMRKVIKLMRLAAGCVLAVSMLVLNSSGMVLCIGDDGHIEVEPVHENHCDHPLDESGDAHEEHSHSSSDPCEEGNHGCVDMSLDLDKVTQTAKDLKHDHLLKQTVCKDLTATFLANIYADGQCARSLINKGPPRLLQSIQVQQTIVLLL